ncbi:MAG: Ig-like domain-containing protein [Patescibacteria group bacterium]
MVRLLRVGSRTLWVTVAAVTFGALVALPTFAQGLDLGLTEFGANLGLGGGDPRIVIARVIRVLLGFLGIIAVLLIIYAGYLWMTAAGDDDKVRQARLVLVNALIGLVIILSAYAAVSFIISRFLGEAGGTVTCSAGDPPIACTAAGCDGQRTCDDTDGNGTYTYGTCVPNPSCTVRARAFVVSSYSPPNGAVGAARNVVIKIGFNEAVTASTLTYGAATDSVRIYPTADPSAIIPGVLNTTTVGDTNSRQAVFTPSAFCEPPNEDLRCFAKDTEYTVAVSEDVVTSVSDRSLDCSYPSNPCTAIIGVGDKIDLLPPTVSIRQPAGKFAPAESNNPFIARAVDDVAVSDLSFSDLQATPTLIGIVGPTGAPYTPYVGTVSWSTYGYAVNSDHTLEVKATDWADHETTVTKTVRIRAAHCFDGELSGDETAADCGGGCGACAGESCAEDPAAPICTVDEFACSASSVCDPNGCTCAANPVITAVSPNDGAPGSFITLAGSGFGSSAGQVIFLGIDVDGDGDPRDSGIGTDDAVAVAPASCAPADAWQTNQVIVAVPASAVDGPLALVTNLGLEDRTNEGAGPVIPNFDVNATVRPGLCAITPSSGCVNVPVLPSAAFSGEGFGLTTGRVLFGSIAAAVQAWAPAQILATIANIAPSTIGVRVEHDNEEQSNPVNFTAQSCVAAPRVTAITPAAGPVGQIVTVTGANFGSEIGKVYFAPKTGGAGVEVSWSDFPEACGPSAYWKNSQIVLKVPAGVTVAEQILYVVRRDAVESNKDVIFTVNTSAPTPGLYCSLPDNGPESVSVQLYGDNFGGAQEVDSVTGQVRFYDGNQTVVNPVTAGVESSVSRWVNNSIAATVPDNAVTGPIRVTRVAASNPLQFSVQSCLEVGNECGEGSQCCGDGSCIPSSDTCPVPPRTVLSSYRWRFTTGNPAPRVVEENACFAQGNGTGTQSPSPWKDSNDACTNAQVSVRFTTPLNPASLVSAAASLDECGDSQACAAPVGTVALGLPVAFTYTAADGRELGGFTVAPGGLKANTWYRATITTAVTSDANVPMQAPYTWQFRTSSGPCVVAAVSCQPVNGSLKAKFETKDLLAGLEAANCNILACSTPPAPGILDWSSFASTVASIDATLHYCTNRATAIAEGSTSIFPRPVSEPAAKVQMCKLKVLFAAPEVLEHFPSCSEACINASVGVLFTRAIDPTSITHDVTSPSASVQLYKCSGQTTETCTTRASISVPNLSVWDDPATTDTETIPQLTFSLAASALLEKNTTYRVVLTTGIKSTEGKSLVANSSDGTYAWLFTTKDSECAVAQVDVSPKETTVNTIGATVPYFAQPFGSPDACRPAGQRLVATAYGYDWSSTDAAVGVVSAADDLPPADRIDPAQITTAIGQAPSCSVTPFACSTTVSAIAEGKTGEGEFTLQCGFEQPGRCAPLGENLATNGSFEAAPANGNILRWGDLEHPYSADFLVAGDAAAGKNYYRQKDCDSAACPFAEGLAREMVSSKPIAGTAFTVRLQARHSEGDKEVRAWLATYDDATNELNRLTTFTFAGEAGVDLGSTWAQAVGVATVPAGTTDNVFYLVIEIPAGTEIDAIELVHHTCSNEASRACSTNAQCNSQVDGTPLNLCGGGQPSGMCDSGTKRCSNDPQVSCADANGAANDALCTFAVNAGGCCGVRPYVESIIGSINTTPGADENKLCRNAAFTTTFSQLMDTASVRANVGLQWLDVVGDTTDCDMSKSLAYLEQGPVRRLWSKVRAVLITAVGAQASGTWCSVGGTSTAVVPILGGTGQPIKSTAILSVSQLLEPKLTYRISVYGETDARPLGGAKNLAGIAMAGEVVQSFASIAGDGSISARPAVGNTICAVAGVDIEVLPELSRDMLQARPRTPSMPYDVFNCFGDNCSCKKETGKLACRLTDHGEVDEDQDEVTASNQHTYIATARDAVGQPLSATYGWTTDDPSSLFADIQPGSGQTQTLTLENQKNGFAQAKVAASFAGLPQASGSQVVPIVVQLCKAPWTAASGALQDGPGDDKTNFYTTYCRDTGKDLLPDFDPLSIGKPSGQNPLNILNEWILKDPSSADAIGIRVVRNDRHLSPTQWYTEQAFKEGSPQDLLVDGYPAVRDGRTVYVAGGNAVQSAGKDVLYTNIYIFSYNQNAKASTVNVFNQLVQNLVLTINHLSVGSCSKIDTGELSTISLCSNNAAKRCSQNAECGKVCVGGTNAGVTCVNNDQCTGGGSCTGTGQCVAQPKVCLRDTECGVGYSCNADKPAIARDTKRLADIMTVSDALAGYQYGVSCTAVTPGAPGDANCDGLLSGPDVTLTQWYRSGGAIMPAYCSGADYDGDDDVDATDVSSVTNAVRANCKRPDGATTNFPPLAAGSYVPGTTISVWPSWVATLGNALGQQLPADPFNRLAECEASSQSFASTHNVKTCWDEISKTYASHYSTVDGNSGKITHVEPPPDVPWPDGDKPASQVYTYSAYGHCSIDTGTACLTDAHCLAEQTCIARGENYASCTFFEREYAPTPGILGQTTAGSRLCLVTSQSVKDRLPEPPTGTVIGDETIIPPSPDFAAFRLSIGGNGAGRVHILKDNSIVDSLVKPLGASVAHDFVYEKGDTIVIRIVTDATYSAGAWDGACRGRSLGSDCTLTIDGFRAVSTSIRSEATFSIRATADSLGDARATITSAGGGTWTCASVVTGCDYEFEKGESLSVQLAVDPATEFIGWEGSCPLGSESGASCVSIPLNDSLTVTPKLDANPPTVSSFDFGSGPSTYVSGDPFTVRWTSTSAEVARLTSNDGSINTDVTVSGEYTGTAVSGMNTLTLTVTSPGGTASRDLAISVNAATAIDSFSANPSSIVLGQSTTLSWSVSGGPTSFKLYSIDGADETALVPEPAVNDTSRIDTPTKAGPKKYKLVANGPGGTAEATVDITVANPPPPVIDSFTASASTVEVNKPVTLTWSISGTTPTSLGLQVDGVDSTPAPVVGSTSKTFTPTSIGPKTYKLIATSDGGPTSAEVTVNVVNPPSITSFRVQGPGSSFGPTAEVGTGDTITFDWITTNANTAAIDGGVSPVAPASVNAGSKTFTVTSATTRDIVFTFTATGAVSSRTATVTVTVHRTPVIILWADTSGSSVEDTSLTVDGDDSVRLTWGGDEEFGSITGFTPSPGSYNPASATGQLTITPALASPSTTTYTITVRGKFGTTAESTASDTVTVIVRPTITLNFTGTGSGSVAFASSQCDANCTYYPNSGDSVTLTATADSDSRFTGWTGCPSGTTSPCTLTADSSMTVTANFVKAFVLTLEKRNATTNAPTGEGTVAVQTVNPVSGGNKPSSTDSPVVGSPETGFVESYTDGTSVSLNAIDGANVKFQSWSGACAGTDPLNCTVSMSANRTVFANFLSKPLQPILTVHPACTSAAPCSPNQSFYFTWSGGEGATVIKLNPGDITVSGGRWPTGSGTVKSGSAVYTLSAINDAGSTPSAPVEVWIDWSQTEQFLAGGTPANGNVSPEQGRHNEASPRVVVTNDRDGIRSNDITYAFYTGQGANGTCRYVKGSAPTSSTFTLASALDITAQCRHVAVWYDKWTPGVPKAPATDDVIHLATTLSGVPSATPYQKDQINYFTMSAASTNSPSLTFRKGTSTSASNVTDAEQISVIRRVAGNGFFTFAKNLLSYVDQCVLNNSAACTRLTHPYANNDDVSTQLVPLVAGDSLGLSPAVSDVLVQHSPLSSTVVASFWNGSAWTPNMTIASNVIMTGYEGALSVLTNVIDNKASLRSDNPLGDTYIAWKDDQNLIDNADTITIRRRQFGTTSFVTSLPYISLGGFGIHDLALGLDARSGYLYVVYAERTQNGTPASAIVRYVRSAKSTSDPEWVTAGWTSPKTVIATTADYRNVSVNYLSEDRLYVTAASVTDGQGAALRGATVNVLTGPQ